MFARFTVSATRVFFGKTTALALNGLLSSVGVPVKPILFGPSKALIASAKPIIKQLDEAGAGKFLSKLGSFTMDWVAEKQTARREEIVANRKQAAEESRKAEEARQAEVPPINLAEASTADMADWLVKHSALSPSEMHELQQMLSGQKPGPYSTNQIQLLSKYKLKVEKHIQFNAAEALPAALQAGAQDFINKKMAEALAAAQSKMPIQLEETTDEELGQMIMNQSQLTLSEMKELLQAFHDKKNGSHVDVDDAILNKYSANITQRTKMDSEKYLSQLDPAHQASFNQADYFLDRQLAALGIAITLAEKAATQSQAVPPLKLATATTAELGAWLVQHSGLNAQEMQQLHQILQASQAGQAPTAEQSDLLSKYKTHIQAHIEKCDPEGLIPDFIVGEQRKAMVANFELNKMTAALAAAIAQQNASPPQPTPATQQPEPTPPSPASDSSSSPPAPKLKFAEASDPAIADWIVKNSKLTLDEMKAIYQAVLSTDPASHLSRELQEKFDANVTQHMDLSTEEIKKKMTPERLASFNENAYILEKTVLALGLAIEAKEAE